MAYTDREDLNYLGDLYLIGQYATPFLSMIGGLNGGKTYSHFKFPVAQPWSLQAASQDTQSEATSAAAGTPVTTTRAQDYNVAQIMKKDIAVTYAKQSTTGEFSGIQVLGNQPVADEMAFQKSAQLRQLAIDVEYSFLQGTFTDSNLASTNQKTRGILAATTTNSVDATTTALSKDQIDELLRDMVTTGSPLDNAVIFVNAFQKQQISNIYGYAPEDRNVGGVNIQQIETDFARLGIVYAPYMPTDELLIAEMTVCNPVFVPHEGGQIVSFTETAVDAAKKGGFFYTQIGLDYGPEEHHGKIINLTTS